MNHKKMGKNNKVTNNKVTKSQSFSSIFTADINQVKADVLPFIRNPKDMGIWSNDYFLQLAQMIRFE